MISADKTFPIQKKHSSLVGVVSAGVQWGPISVCQQIPSEGCSGKFQPFSDYYKRAMQGETQSVACLSLIQSLVNSLCGKPWRLFADVVLGHVSMFGKEYICREQ